MQHIKIDIPAYRIDTAPDDKTIGKIIDDELKKHFPGRSILVRGIASSEHPGKSATELVHVIQQTGTDKYDPIRRGDRYENIKGKHIDLFAFPATVSPSMTVGYQIIYGFYHSAIAIHGHPVRIDVVIVYDANQMQQVPHQYKDRDDIKDDGFVFKDPKNKPAAVLGVMEIL